MAKSIFDRNPITEMFSSIEEAMRCANSKELNNMLRNSFKDITTDPILGKQNKSKESMSITIISGDDLNDLNNINTLENGGKMKKFQYTGRYADGGKNLKPIPADNKGLQALAKKNPKLVMDMGFDPNSVAGGTKGKKKKGPKVPKNQDGVMGASSGFDRDLGVNPRRIEGITYNPSTGQPILPGTNPNAMTVNLPSGMAGTTFNPFSQEFKSLSREVDAAKDAAMDQDAIDYFEMKDGGMAPNLGAYPDIVYLTRFDAGGKQRKVPGYQDMTNYEDLTSVRQPGTRQPIGFLQPDGSQQAGVPYNSPRTSFTSTDDQGRIITDADGNVVYRDAEGNIVDGQTYSFQFPEGTQGLGVGDNLTQISTFLDSDVEDYFKSNSITGDPNSPYYVKPETYEDVGEGFNYQVEVDFDEEPTHEYGENLFDPAETDMILQARGLDPAEYKSLTNEQVMQAVEEANQYAPGTYQTGSVKGGGMGGFFGAHNFEAVQASLDKMVGIERGTDDKYKTGQQRLDAIKGEYDRVNALANASAGYEEELADVKAMYDAGEITKEQYDRRAGIITGQSASGDPQLQNLPFFREGKSSASSASSASGASGASGSSSRADNKDRSNYPGSVFKSAGLNIRDFQTGEFAGGSADGNRELRRRLQEHLAAGGTPETFSVRQTAATMEAPQLAKLDAAPIANRLPEDAMEKVSLSEEQMTPRSRREFRQDNRQDRSADRQATRRANRLERLEGRLETSQQRRDDRQARQDARQVRQDDRQQFKGQVQDLRGQIREARRGGDGMYFNPMFYGGGQMMAGVPTNQNIPNGGQMPPVANFARDGKMINPPAVAQPTGSMNDTINQLRMDVSSGKISAQDAANMMASMFAAGNK